MLTLWRDFRFGLRVVSSSPGFTLAAVLTLGLGIACTTTVFSWIDSVLLHPYPGTARTEELVAVEMITRGAPNGGTSISWLDYRDYRDRLKSFTGLTVQRQCAFTLGDGSGSRLVWGELVSGNYFDVMGVRPRLGRTFTQEEQSDALGAPAVAVIGERLWQSYYRRDPAVVGKTIRINRRSLTVVGVAPLEFRGSSPVMLYDVWIPVTMSAALGSMPDASFRERGERGPLTAIARLRPGIPVAQARHEVATLAAGLAVAYPNTNRGVSATVLPTWEAHNGVTEYLRAPLAILLAISVLVLLIVCANVANLLLARSVGRQREFGIRVALGAGRSRVALQVLVETSVLAAAGTGIGLLLLLWMQGSLVAMVPSVGFPLKTSLAWNGSIAAFTVLACVVAGLLSGVSPALFVFHANLNEVLKDGSRSDTVGAASHRTRSLLVIGEVALATVALVGGGLFVRSFRNLRAVHPGFETNGVLLGRFFIESAGYTSAEVDSFAARLKDRLMASSEVEAVAYTDFVPLSTTAGPYSGVRVDGYVPAPGESTAVNRALVSPGYFNTLRMPLLEGRDFDERETREAAPAMVVNQAFAARFLRGQNPVGRRVRVQGKWCTVIGMVRDSKYFSPGERPRPFYYLAFTQFYTGSTEIDFLMRGQGPAAQAAPLLRRTVSATDPRAAAFHAVPLAEYTEVATFGQKVAANLMGALGLLCLILAAVGLFSVMAYTVSQRRAEIGIRMAMGAGPRDVVAMVVGQGLRLAGVGVAAGAGAAWISARLIGGLLYGVQPSDPATYILATLFLLVVAVVATGLPAIRAIHIDPIDALRR